jgi:hypothetical protein
MRSSLSAANRTTCLGIWVFAAGCANLGAAPVRIEAEAGKASLANDFVSVEFDLGNRGFSIRDSQSGEVILEQAAFDTRFPEGGELSVYRKEEVLDVLGGKSIGNPQTLNGSACMDGNHLANGLDRVSSNSLMLTGRVDGKRRTAVWGRMGNRAFAKIATLKPHPASVELRILTIESPQSGEVRWSARHADRQ